MRLPARPVVRPRPRLAAVAACALLVVATSACGEDVATVEISDARMAVPAEEQAAVYLTLHNPGDTPDVLVSAFSSASPMIHLHASKVDSAGSASMAKVQPLEVPADGTVRLEPGGTHLMMMYPEPVAAGDEVSLTLNFERAGNVTTKVDVVDVVEPSAP